MATEPLPGIGITLSLEGKVIGVAERVGKTYALATYILEIEPKIVYKASEESNTSL